MLIYLSLLIALIGVLMYALCANPKLQEIGKIAFFCGLLAFLIVFGAGKKIGVLSENGGKEDLQSAAG